MMKERAWSSKNTLTLFVAVLEILRFYRAGNFKNILWYIDLSNSNCFFSSTIAIILPELFFYILWGDYFEENVYKNETLLLPRAVSVWKILQKYYVSLSIRVALPVAIICFFISVSQGYNYFREEDYINFALYYCYIFLQIIFVNMLSAISSSLIAVLITISVQIVNMQLINTFWTDNMVAQQFLLGGELFLLQKEGIMYQKYLKILYAAIVIIMLMFIHCEILKKKDWR